MYAVQIAPHVIAMRTCVMDVMKLRVRYFTCLRVRPAQSMNVRLIPISIVIVVNVRRLHAIYGEVQETLNSQMRNLRRILGREPGI